MIKSPIKYFGGKGTMINKIIPHFPKEESYTTFIDLYGGSGTVLLSRPLGHVEIYNDIYKNVYSLFKVLEDKSMFEEFKHKCDLSIYSSDLRKEFKENLQQNSLSFVDRAFYFWYVNRTSYNGVGGLNVMKVIRRGMSKSTSDFLSAIDRLKELHDRLSSVLILNEDAFSLIDKMDAPDVFMYLDPPYHPFTRSSGGYVHEYSENDHEKLIDKLLKCRSKILLSGYSCKQYERLLPKFKQINFDVSTLDGNNSPETKVESLWKNYQ